MGCGLEAHAFDMYIHKDLSFMVVPSCGSVSLPGHLFVRMTFDATAERAPFVTHLS